MVLKRINRVVCLEDRKAVPMAGRGRKWMEVRTIVPKKVEQIQKK